MRKLFYFYYMIHKILLAIAIVALGSSEMKMTGAVIVQLAFVIFMIVIRPFNTKMRFFANLLSELLVLLAIVMMFLASTTGEEQFNTLFVLFFITSVLINLTAAIVNMCDKSDKEEHLNRV